MDDIFQHGVHESSRNSLRITPGWANITKQYLV